MIIQFGGLAENIFHWTFICLPLLSFPLSFEILYQTACLKQREMFHVIYYFIFIKKKSFLLVLYPKFDMSAETNPSNNV